MEVTHTHTHKRARTAPHLAVQLLHLTSCYYYPTTPLASKKETRTKRGIEWDTVVYIMVGCGFV